MKRITGLCVAAVFVSGAAFGVDYTFVGTTFPAAWDTLGNWTPALVLPGTSVDSYTITSPTSADNIVYLPNPANVRYFGSLTMTSGRLAYTGTATDTLRFAADNGQSGSFVLKGVSATSVNFGKSNWSQGANWDMDGDFIYDGQVYSSEQYGQPGRNSTVTMRGADTTFTMSANAGSGMQLVRVTVAGGASVNFVQPTLAGYNATRELVINGTASGSIISSANNLSNPANNYFVKVGGSADVTGLELTFGVASDPTAVYWISGAHYKEFEYTGAGYIGNNATPRVWTMKLVDGDLQANNIKLGRKIYPADPRAGYFVIDTDNGGVVRNVTANNDMVLGDWWSGVLKANSANVKIGRDLLVNDPASTQASYVTATTATIRLGRNLTVVNGAETLAAGWNMGASTVICDGNGTSKAQTITSKGLPFYNVEINNPGGAVTLADNLVLKGDFGLVAGSFNPASYYVVFKGGVDCETTAQEIDVDTGVALSRVYIQAGSSTFVKLMNNLIVSDNLDIDTGCKLFLNGFTLDLTGSDAALFLGQNTLSGEGTWTLKEGGEIIGGAAIPEPATLLLLGTGALGVLGYVRRRRMQ